MLALALVALQQAAPKLVQLDLDADVARQVVVDREPGQYLGHPTTVLLEDGRTMLCVYPKGHGKGAIVMKRSSDGGRTWSERLPTPDNWSTSLETPTIHRVVDDKGNKRLILFSGLHPARMARSDDDGEHWTPLEPIGEWGGIVVMASVERMKNGDYLAFFHDDGRYFRATGAAGGTFTLFQTRSTDGGLTWGEPRAILATTETHLCEPGAVRSPDSKELTLLLRENRRVRNSFAMTTRDEGETWDAPRELSRALTGDRHTAKYAPDGRLVVSFRDMAADSATRGDWVAWVGRFDDVAHGRDGQYRVRLKDNHKGTDCGYPGLELLPDGTFVATTYGHWSKDEAPYILSVRFTLAELDALAARRD